VAYSDHDVCFTPKADIRRQLFEVRFVPIGDIAPQIIRVLKGASKPYLRVKVQSCRESGALENGFRERAGFEGAEVRVWILKISHVF
jgi:hypothetical protein